MKQVSWLFNSFFLAGFESSTHLTLEGRRLDLIAATQHDRQAGPDYALCRATGIKAVREAARWPIIDQKGQLDLQEVGLLARLGREAGLIQIWDLMHYGYPEDLDPFSSQFIERFAAYAGAVARVVRAETDGPLYFTPVNEISYLAWSAGEVGFMAPFAHGRGGEYKRVLVRAAIAAANAIREVDSQATMVSVDPLVRLHAPAGRPDLQAEADDFNTNIVNEAFDLLSGRLEPELGGSRANLGIVGLNYYAGNQWTIATPEIPRRFLDVDEPGWLSLTDILAELQARYGGPLIIAETGSSGDGRVPWLRHLQQELRQTLERGVDLQGVCLYPIVTSPDWEDPTAFFNGGLFDLSPQPDGQLKRVLTIPLAAALRQAQAEFDPQNLPASILPAEPPTAPEPALMFIRPLEQARFKPDNFSYQTLLAGEQLVVELYCFEPGGAMAGHSHEHTEHVLTVVEGYGNVRIGSRWITLRMGETLLIPAKVYYGIHNHTIERLVVQQVSAPKPWDARFEGPHPSQIRPDQEPSQL